MVIFRMRTRWMRAVLSVVAAWMLAGVARGDTPPTTRPTTLPLVRIVGHIAYRPIEESSGVVASRRYPGVLWTHNDSGNKPALYAIDAQGKLIGEFRVGAENVDWEDIANDDEGHLYIGDIGNNNRTRQKLTVYRVDEPDPRDGNGRKLNVTESWQLTYPDAPFDCESLFVYQGWGYVISKLFNGHEAGLYRFPLKKQDRPAVLEKVADLPIRVPVTAADISADGKRLAVMSVLGLYEFAIDGDVARAGTVRPVYLMYVNARMEACTFVPEGILATAETREIVLFPDLLKD